jgi:hypothetical protein
MRSYNSTHDNEYWADLNGDLFTNKSENYALISKIEELKKLNVTFETTTDPTILENVKSEIELLVQYCITHEKNYPNSVKLKDSEKILYRVKERYNERIYLIAKKSIGKYKLKIFKKIPESEKDFETEIIFSKIQNYQGYLDKTAKNYKECLSAFTKFHDEVEDLFSNIAYNDMEISEAFTILLEKEPFKDYVIAIIQLVCNNELNKENLDNTLKEYRINNIKDIKLDLLDLILSYVRFVTNTNIITEKERNDIETLKLYFRIKEGDFYKNRYNEIKSICQKQFSLLLSDNNPDCGDELFMVELQGVFDLSYSQLEKLKQIK